MTQDHHSQDQCSELRTRAQESLGTMSVDHDDISQLSQEEIQRLVHELRVHQIELEMQNEELRQTQSKLEELKDKYLDLYDFAPLGYMTLNNKGLILESNLTATQLLGVERKTLTMMFLSSFVCKEFSDAFYLYLRQLFESQSRRTCEIKLTRKDGTVFYAQLETVPVQEESGLSNRCRTVLTDITEHKKADEALRLSEAQKTAILNGITTNIAFVNDKLEILWVNRAAAESVKKSPEEMIGVTCHSLWANPEGPCENCPTVRAFQTKRPEKIIMTTPDGRVWDERGEPIFDDRGNLIGVVELAQDISEVKRGEETLRESEEKYRSIFEDSIDGIFITSTDGTLIDANQSFLDILGYKSEEIVGASILKCYANLADRKLVLHDLDQRGAVKDYPLNLVKKDGTEMDSLLTATVRKDSDGKILGYRGIVRDVTEFKQALTELKESEERYRTVANFTYDWEYWVSPDGNLLYISPSCERITGYSPEDFIRDPDLMNRIVHPDDRSRMLEHFHLARTVDFETPYALDFRIIHRDGQTRWINHACQPVHGEAGQPLGRRSCNRDITKRKRYEFAQRRLAKAIEHAAEGIIITDSTGIIQYVNPAEETITGYNRDELIGQMPSIFKSHIHDQSFDKKLWETLTTGNVWSGRFINKKKDGTKYHEDASISPVYDDSGNLTNFVAVKHDVTERLKLQQQLLQAQKMEAVGTLAGGVAHDFNNLLQIVSGYSELLLIDKNSDHRDYDNLRKINATATRGADLVQRLMVFSRKSDSKQRPLNLNHEVAQVTKLLERTIPKMIAIELSLEGNLPVINADPVQVEQILMNLAINAKDAIPETGGKLTIETKNVTLDEEYCRMHLEASPGQFVMLSVSDTGHGMSQETIQHIFEPFFTTKCVGKGTGLGLAMVYGIVKQHGGFINCYSEPNKGSAFQIYFPVAPSELEENLEQGTQIPPGGSETVLLVDDEEFVCDTGSKLLTRAGYTVLKATNARDAINVYRNQRTDISLVILDLIMPEMGGKECFQELVNIEPKIKVILSSGFLSDETTKEITALGFRGFVQKPHNMRQLLGIVRQVLDGD